MMERRNTGSGRGTRLRALDEQTLVPPKGIFFLYSNIPGYSFASYPFDYPSLAKISG